MKNDLPVIAGGAPAKTCPFGKEPRYGEAELKQLAEAIEQQSLFYAHGRKVKELEAGFARLAGVRHGVATSSGTAAIATALIALGISPGDEVVVPPITDAGSVLPILWQGAVPVFADVDGSGLMSPESLERAITPCTRAVVVVHLAGNACDMDAISSICRSANIDIVEDCAQAYGCEWHGRHVGAVGRVGCFSLNEFKHIACGDGGVCTTDDPAIATRLRLATDKGYDRGAAEGMRNPTFLANNYRMTELQGAVGLAQLGKLDSIVSRRHAWCEELTARLSSVPGLALPMPTPGSKHSYWFYMFRVDPAVVGAGVDELCSALRAEGLPVSPHYIGRCVYEYPLMHNHSAFARGTHPYGVRKYGPQLCPNAENVLASCIVMAVNEAYTQQDLHETVEAFTKCATWFRSR